MEKSSFFRLSHFKMGCQPANLTLDCITFSYIYFSITFEQALNCIYLMFLLYFSIHKTIKKMKKLYVKTLDFFLVLKSMVESENKLLN